MKTAYYIIIVFSSLMMLLFCSYRTNSDELKITEFMAHNELSFIDSLGFNSDWIELYNSSIKDIDLSNFFISDNIKKLNKYQLRGVLSPNTYLVISSSKDTITNHNFPFKLSKQGGDILLCDSKKKVLQHIEYNEQLEDVSYSELNGKWSYNLSPTPGKKNIDSDLKYFRSEEVEIKFLEENGDIKATLYSDSEDNILYTINGESPFSENAIKYTEPIHLDTFLLVRAALNGPRTVIHDEKMCSYVNQSYHTLPVFSLSTDPKSLWDQQNGLFINSIKLKNDERVKGQVNYFSDSIATHEFINFKLSGNGSRKSDKKSFNFKGRSDITNYFFNSINANKIDGFTVRACRPNFKYRNELVGNVNQYMNSEMLMQEYVPAAFYINGEYWGIYNIMEKKNDEFVKNHTGSLPDHMITVFTSNNPKVEKGDSFTYLNLLEQLNNTTNEERILKILNDNFNVNSLLDFWCHEIILGRVDTYNNRLWKDLDSDNKWNFISYDYDMCFIAPESNNFIERYLNSPKAEGIRHIGAFMQSKKFRDIYVYKILEYLNFGYSENNILEMLNRYDRITSQEFKMDAVRWNNEKYSSFSSKVKHFQQYLSIRKKYLLDVYFPTIGYHDKVIFSIPDSTQVNILINDFESKGQICFYAGMSVKIEVKNKDNWRFIGWKDENGNMIDVSNNFTSQESVILSPVCERY